MSLSSSDQLAVIAQEAVALQPAAEHVMAACLAPAVNGQLLARQGSQVALGYFNLRKRLNALDGGAQREELDQLLNYHHHVLEGCLELAYRDARTRAHVAAQFEATLGAAGDRLRQLAAELTITDERPPGESHVG